MGILISNIYVKRIFTLKQGTLSVYDIKNLSMNSHDDGSILCLENS